jgi:hypothetical protein
VEAASHYTLFLRSLNSYSIRIPFEPHPVHKFAST